jgi:hypothetical protein
MSNMFNLLLFHASYCICTSYLAHFNLGHLFGYVIEPTEQELEEPTEEAQVKHPTNLALDQCKPRCI